MNKDFVNVDSISKAFNGAKVKIKSMSQTRLEKELKLIRQRLDAIEEALGEEMTKEDKRLLKDALREHREGKSTPFNKVRQH